ncbi:MAG: histidinol-phosphate transaminase [Candidatus Methanospirareceae archaeon]
MRNIGIIRGTLDYLEAYDAGKFPEEISKEYGVPLEKIINLNSNENPYPPPESIIRAITEEAKKISRYPNPSYEELKKELASYLDVSIENIAIGNGANEILACICNAFLEPFDKVVIPIPTYTLYAFYSMMRDAKLEFIETEEKEFIVSSDEVLTASKDAKLVFLCSPNNPTGAVIDKEEMMKIVENTKALVIVDEAYVEFYGKSIVKEAVNYENLIVLRSFSKFFALAGLRIGYAITNPQIASYLEKIRQPFSISNIAERAAIEALKEREYFAKICNLIIKDREYLFDALREIDGLKPFPSKANFILVKLLDISSSELMEELFKEGIIIRDVTNLLGLNGDYVRITVGRSDENRKFISILKKILQS